MNNLTLFDDFKSWMEGKGYKPTVSSSYVSYLRTLLRKLHSGGYSVIPNAEELLNSAVSYPSLIKGLLKYFNNAINAALDDTSGSITVKQLNNGRSAFRKFVEFMLGYAGVIHNNVQNNIQPAAKQAPKYIKPAKAYQNMMGWRKFTQDEIVRIIKSRLGTQDRLSGNKVWLSIRVVKGLNGTEWFDKWCNSIVSKTKVLIDEYGGYIMLNQVDELILKPEGDGKYSVWVFVDGKEYRVYTHTKDKTVISMSVKKGVKEVSLEHVTPIDETLRKLEDKKELPQLTKISDVLKEVSKELKLKRPDGAKIKAKLSIDGNVLSKKSKNGNDEPKISVNLDELRKEMEAIKNDTDYELMHIRENSGKGKNS